MLARSDDARQRPLGAAPTEKARERTGRARTLALAALFVTAQVAIIVFGTTALEGVNAMRAYATGEAQWSKAQKRAVISLMHYAGSRDESDLSAFRGAMAVIDGDTQARLALEKTPPDMDAAAQGFIGGLNAPADVNGLSWGFLLLHRWEPFAQAVNDWRRADSLTARLWYLSGSLRGAIEAGAPLGRVREILTDIGDLDREFSLNEYKFSVHMGEASRAAKALTLLVMEIVSLFVCVIVAVLARHIADAGARAEGRERAKAARAMDFAELASDWHCELDRNLCVTEISSRFALFSGGANPVNQHWLRLGLMPLNSMHNEALSRHISFRDHRFLQETGTPVYYWSVSGRALFDEQEAFTGYLITATDVTSFMRTTAQRTESQSGLVARVA